MDSDLKQQLLDAKKFVIDTEQQLRDSLQVNKDDLVLSLVDNKYYRARFVSLDEELNPKVNIKEIKNHSVNWESCSLKGLYAGQFEVIEWEFDHEKLDELVESYYQSDSVSERDTLKDEIEDMIFSCHHSWQYDMSDDSYTCSCCGASTKMTTSKDWLNGEIENHNIDMESTLCELGVD